MLIYFTEITILHVSCYYYEYGSYILIILMLVYSVKSSKYGISCIQIYYVISWKRYLFLCNSIPRNWATSQGLEELVNIILTFKLAKSRTTICRYGLESIKYLASG
jgi:hypothetical protein